MTSIVAILEQHQDELGQVIQRCHEAGFQAIKDDMVHVALDALCRRGWRGVSSDSEWTHPDHNGIYHWNQAFQIEFPRP